jgi:hypothetical protein
VRPAPLLGEGLTVSLDDELDEAAQAERDKMRAAFKPEDLAQYAIKGAVWFGGGGLLQEMWACLKRCCTTLAHAAP